MVTTKEHTKRRKNHFICGVCVCVIVYLQLSKCFKAGSQLLLVRRRHDSVEQVNTLLMMRGFSCTPINIIEKLRNS